MNRVRRIDSKGGVLCGVQWDLDALVFDRAAPPTLPTLPAPLCCDTCAKCPATRQATTPSPPPPLDRRAGEGVTESLAKNPPPSRSNEAEFEWRPKSNCKTHQSMFFGREASLLFYPWSRTTTFRLRLRAMSFLANVTSV